MASSSRKYSLYLDEQQKADLKSASAGRTKTITDPYEYGGIWFLFENHNWYKGNGDRGGFISTVSTGTSKDSVPPIPKMPFINDRQLYVEKDKQLQTRSESGLHTVGQKTPDAVSQTLMELLGKGRIVQDAYIIKQFFYHLIDWEEMSTIIQLEGGKAEAVNQQVYMKDPSGKIYRVKTTVSLELVGDEKELEAKGISLPLQKDEPLLLEAVVEVLATHTRRSCLLALVVLGHR